MIHRLNVSGDWYDEFYAEGLLALWQAFGEFDEAKGDVGTFLNYRIRFRLIDLLRKKVREKEVKEELVRRTERELLKGTRHRATDMELVDPAGVELVDDTFWKLVRERLSDVQWKWVYYFIICDLSVKEIMELEDVAAHTVKNWGRSAREKLRDMALLEELQQYL